MATFATIEDYLASLPEPQRRIADRLCPLVDDVLPGRGAVWHGHPVWSLGEAPGKSPVCYLKAYSRHVTLGFWRGQELADPAGRLEAGARGMAAVKLHSVDGVDAALFTGWLRQARDLEAAARA
ncbi:hypothetical protein SAMN05421810_101640 [Amycolatopsis arida]|uniref:YdhG-like domain-containing protein n=1 Tax=Amycolatopsis arida TaxID=587909 RepID=A0A1I5LRB4_9PSEU|nr:DUF1801 domain-containing protein [Amycolatopsis arida]TDX93817.1 hypothetical protein CLV69_104273 [Amycolatopsis arida]SFO99879.1 hypothetical protein SAMN05421810_101640 [Amycolatopsis arida]